MAEKWKEVNKSAFTEYLEKFEAKRIELEIPERMTPEQARSINDALIPENMKDFNLVCRVMGGVTIKEN